MPTALTPDFEALVATYLLEHDAVVALVGERIGGRHPESVSEPWVKITQIDETVFSRSTHLAEAHFQIDCYGGDDLDASQGEAIELARTVRAALNDMETVEHEDAVVTGVTFSGNRRLPDSDFAPARERKALDVNVFGHTA